MEALGTLTEEPTWRIPFVTSIVLVTALPHSEASQPYSVIVGHLSSLFLPGPGNTSSAFGVGVASFAMLALRAPHPPAGIDAFLVAANGLSLPWVVSPVLVGCILLALFSQAWSIGERRLFGDSGLSP